MNQQEKDARDTERQRCIEHLAAGAASPAAMAIAVEAIRAGEDLNDVYIARYACAGRAPIVAARKAAQAEAENDRWLEKVRKEMAYVREG